MDDRPPPPYEPVEPYPLPTLGTLPFPLLTLIISYLTTFLPRSPLDQATTLLWLIKEARLTSRMFYRGWSPTPASLLPRQARAHPFLLLPPSFSDPNTPSQPPSPVLPLPHSTAVLLGPQSTLRGRNLVLRPLLLRPWRLVIPSRDRDLGSVHRRPSERTVRDAGERGLRRDELEGGFVWALPGLSLFPSSQPVHPFSRRIFAHSPPVPVFLPLHFLYYLPTLSAYLLLSLS